MIVRFDDVSTNTDMDNAEQLARFCQSMGAEVMWAISPLVHDIPEGESPERVFPGMLKAFSDFRRFFGVTKMGVPRAPDGTLLASHGLVHVDHRLLCYEAQELSILVSCSLVAAPVFVPPFNKWNEATEEICLENGINLVKFEDGWRSCEHNERSPHQEKWYLHSRRWTLESFQAWWGK